MRAVGTSSFMRLKARSIVLLPQPEGPIIAVIFCRCDVQIDVLNGAKVAVVHAQIARFDSVLDAIEALVEAGWLIAIIYTPAETIAQDHGARVQ